MIIFFISLFINIVLGLDRQDGLASIIYKNSKLYVYEPYYEDLKWTGLTIYNLEDGPISDIKSRLINLTSSNPSYTPQFLQLPESLPENRSDGLWMIGGIADENLKSNDLTKENMACEILKDSEMKTHDDFISMPEFMNFPRSGFSQTIVNGNNGPELYIIGGLIYSKEFNAELITNYFYKYEFYTGKWSDLSEATKSILPPRAYHRVIEADNSLLLVGGIKDNKDIKKKVDYSVIDKEQLGFGNISTIYKFDLKNQKWSVVETKLNKDPNIYRNGTAAGSSFDIYKDKIISYTAFVDYETNLIEPQLGILNYKTWEWEWHNVKTEIGTDNSLILSFHQTLIINDQLIMIHGLSNQRQSKKLFVINLSTYAFQGFIDISGEGGMSESSRPPIWAIIVAALGSILSVVLLITISWLYLRYRKRAKENKYSKNKMQDVWASATHESYGKNSGTAALSPSRTDSTNNLMNRTLIDDAIVNYECFQHEVDLEDLSEIKSKTQSN
ncbi:hypothetical protein CONCODRAFT_12353 [Conidiobolus coronatus NRRL 28638]|uniref:Galactose oxidase n=1 Tax=Conidiobolus coronatus (strain ATCC 28846 / CBS 209.66 / NRRL 28638) TaxID=796925 RepID=A0A137NT86_CONC2|nr:hypothetical protein CONCODRAFT_12353 [Conidiobolus coronatus NRRL 28638]|eukprot:KXN65929.1 hypothetical protein CONCODRAFT_12353 [Conidiobolus coronatus NRRL 28638]